MAQAGAAGEALALVDKGFVELEPNTAYIDDEFCSGCRTCVGLCPYNALAFSEELKVVLLNEALCKGCGICVAACPSGALHQHLFDDEQIFAEIRGCWLCLTGDYEPDIVAFCCKWCTYQAADLAGPRA